jgi:hypothetical protein
MSETKMASSALAINTAAPAARIGAIGQPSVQEWTNECIADLKVAQAKIKKLPAARLAGAGDRLLRAIDVFLASVPNTRAEPMANAQPAPPTKDGSSNA